MCGSEDYLGYRTMGLGDVHSRVWDQLFSIIRLVVGTSASLKAPGQPITQTNSLDSGRDQAPRNVKPNFSRRGDYSCFPLGDELVESPLFDEVAAQLNFQMVSRFV